MVAIVFLLLPGSLILAAIIRGRLWKWAMACGALNVAVLAVTAHLVNTAQGFHGIGVAIIGGAVSVVLTVATFSLALVRRPATHPN